MRIHKVLKKSHATGTLPAVPSGTWPPGYVCCIVFVFLLHLFNNFCTVTIIQVDKKKIDISKLIMARANNS